MGSFSFNSSILPGKVSDPETLSTLNSNVSLVSPVNIAVGFYRYAPPRESLIIDRQIMNVAVISASRWRSCITYGTGDGYITARGGIVLWYFDRDNGRGIRFNFGYARSHSLSTEFVHELNLQIPIPKRYTLGKLTLDCNFFPAAQLRIQDQPSQGVLVKDQSTETVWEAKAVPSITCKLTRYTLFVNGEVTWSKHSIDREVLLMEENVEIHEFRNAILDKSEILLYSLNSGLDLPEWKISTGMMVAYYNLPPFYSFQVEKKMKVSGLVGGLILGGQVSENSKTVFCGSHWEFGGY